MSGDPEPHESKAPSQDGIEQPQQRHRRRSNGKDQLDMPVQFSEDALAVLFTAEHAETLVYVHEWGMWLRWEDGRWREDHAVRVFDAARVICRREGNAAASSIPKTGKMIAATINKAAAIAAIEQLRTPPRQACARRRRLRWRPDEAEHAVQQPRSVRHHHAGAAASKPGLHDPNNNGHRGGGRQFARHGSASSTASWTRIWRWSRYLQRVCGYMLTGSVKEHALFFGHGLGGNGKTTFTNVLLGILGTGPSGYSAAAPISTFTASRTEQHPTDLAMLPACAASSHRKPKKAGPGRSRRSR